MAIPQTSVIIPVRNGARFVMDAISSVLSQLRSDDEIIVVDDASTDDTAKLLTSIEDPRVRILRAQGRGVSAARNLGLAAAHGHYLAFLDHDDLWPPGRHEALRAALETNKERTASFGLVRVRFEPGVPETESARGLDGKHVCGLIGSALYLRQPVVDIGGFAEDMHLREDADFHMRLVETGLDPLLCEFDSLIYRRHDSNVTNDEGAIQLALADLLRRKLARQKAKKR